MFVKEISSDRLIRKTNGSTKNSLTWKRKKILSHKIDSNYLSSFSCMWVNHWKTLIANIETKNKCEWTERHWWRFVRNNFWLIKWECFFSISKAYINNPVSKRNLHKHLLIVFLTRYDFCLMGNRNFFLTRIH